MNKGFDGPCSRRVNVSTNKPIEQNGSPIHNEKANTRNSNHENLFICSKNEKVHL